eukprot:6707282-Prymnesium_polylepis.1
MEKTASTTTSGIVRRIAFKNNLSGSRESQWITDEPGVWASHATREWVAEKAAALRRPSVYVSMLRDPADRCLS